MMQEAPQQAKKSNELLDLLDKGALQDVQAGFVNAHAADIADVINRAPQDLQLDLFASVKPDLKADVLAELEDVAGSEIINALSDAELSTVFEDMAPDSAADVLADIPKDRSMHLLNLMHKEESDDVRKLLTYTEDSAGGIMTTDIVTMDADQTVDEALQAIAYIDTHEPFYQAHIIDESGRLTGYVDVWELLRERDRGNKLATIAHTEFVSANVSMDQEDVALLMSKYDLTVIPVVDDNNILVGRITSEDVIDVMEEEASEDILRLAGSDDAELESQSALKSCAIRLPWLFITLFGGFATSLILHHFQKEASLAGMLVLCAFIPSVLAMGGNTGIQSSTLVVRSISLGNLRNRNIFRLLLREIFVGMIMGCICGAMIGLWAHFVINNGSTPVDVSPVIMAVAVAIALFSAMTFATTFGALVPIMLDKMHIDPAVASGPFITIANDISALLIYFGITLLLILGLT